MNRSTRAIFTVLTGWISSVMIAVIGFIATPLLVKWLGPERFGVFKLTEQWFAYLEFVGLGLSPAISILIIKAITKKSEENATRTAWSGFGLLLMQLRWILPAGIILIIIFPIAFNLSDEMIREFYYASIAILFSIAIGPFTVFRSLLLAKQQGYLVNVILLIQALIIAVLGVSFAWFGLGLIGQLWAGAIGLFLASILFLVFSRSTKIFGRVSGVDLIPRKEIWGLRWPLVVAGICNQVSLLSDNLFGGAVFSLKSVTELILSSRLFQLVGIIGGSFNGQGSWVGLVDIWEKDGPEKFADRLTEITKLGVGANLLVLGPALSCNARFVELWIGAEYYAGDLFSIAVVIQATIFNFFCLYTALIDNFGETRQRIASCIFGVIIKLLLIWPLSLAFGIASIPITNSIAYVLTDAWYAPFLIIRRRLVPWKKIASALIRSLSIGAGWIVICIYISNTYFSDIKGWGGLLLEGFILELIGVCLGWYLLLTDSERDKWKHRLRNVRHKLTRHENRENA